MAKIHLTFDNFDDNSINGALWYTFNGGNVGELISETGSQLTLRTGLTGADSALVGSNGPYDLTNSYMQCELASAGNQALASFLIKALRWNGASGGVYFGIKQGTIYAHDGAIKGAVNYNSTNHRWLRIREASGTVRWETALTNTGPWNSFYTTTPAFALGTSTFIENAIESSVEASTTFAVIDNYNIISRVVSTSKQTIRYTVNLPTVTKQVNKTGQTTKQLVTVRTNAVTASKVSTKTASLTQVIVRITTGATTASGGSVADNKTSSTIKQLISVITGATSASKGVNKTSSPAKQVISVITGTLSASKGSSKTASLTKSIIIIQTGTTTVSTGAVPDNKTASLTKAIISIVLNSPTVTISRLKSASTTKANIRFLTNTTSGSIPSASSGIVLTAYGRSRIDQFINSDDLEVVK